MVPWGSPHHIRSRGVGLSAAAAVAAVSIAWFSFRRWKAKNEELLNALKDLGQRIDAFEADEASRKRNKRRKRENNNCRPKRRVSIGVTDQNAIPNRDFLDD